MWKEYSYDQLKGVIKVGDRVRLSGGKEDVVTKVTDYEIYRGKIKHSYSGCCSLERWEELEAPRKIEDGIIEGDLLLSPEGGHTLVLGVCGQVAFLSFEEDHDTYSGTFTRSYLAGKGYTLVTEEEGVEITMEEAKKKLAPLLGTTPENITITE